MHTIRRELRFPQSPETVWHALANSEALAEWMYPNDFEPRVGHRFTAPPRELSFTWIVDGFLDTTHGGWRALGVIEMIGAVLLIVPAASKWMPGLTPIAAVVLAIETLLIAGVYARHSLKLTAENPLIWSVVMLLPCRVRGVRALRDQALT